MELALLTETGSKVGEEARHSLSIIRAIHAEDLSQLARLLADFPQSLVQRAINKVADGCGHTALMVASGLGEAAAVDLLLQHGADPHLHGRGGRTALMCAARRGHLAVVERLLTVKGYDLNQRDNYKVTALFLAAGSGHEMIVRRLLQAGADPTLDPSFRRGLKGTTLGWISVLASEGTLRQALATVPEGSLAASRALEWAVRFGGLTAAKLLLDHGADPLAAHRTPLFLKGNLLDILSEAQALSVPEKRDMAALLLPAMFASKLWQAKSLEDPKGTALALKTLWAQVPEPWKPLGKQAAQALRPLFNGQEDAKKHFYSKV